MSSKYHDPVDLDLFFLYLCNLPNELFAFESLLSISLWILASDEMMQPR